MPVPSDVKCVLCNPEASRIIAANDLAFAVRDTAPVTALHTLVLPRRHVAGYFNLEMAEGHAIRELRHIARSDILAGDPAVEGFNIGVNVGETAGQTIFHCHVHLIPRRCGDVAHPA